MQPTLDVSQRNWGARIRELLHHGIRTIVLENGLLRLGILAGKGTDIVEINYKRRDIDFTWISPGGIRNPIFTPPTSSDPGAPFLDSYPGGWQEVFPSGGAPCAWQGAEFGQHGEVFALPWDVEVVEDSEDTVGVRFSIHTRKMPFLLRKTIRLQAGSPTFSIEESLTNESPVRLPAMWGHHITFGSPFLRPGCTIRLPEGIMAIPHPENVAPSGRRIASPEPFTWPEAVAPDNVPLDVSVIPDRGAPSDLFYLTGFPEHRAWYEIHDEERRIGSRVEWDREVMPYLWYWQEFGAHAGYPWYGRNYNIGLEPFSSFPTSGLAEAVENGSALWMAPGQERRFQLQMSIIDGTRDVFDSIVRE